VEPNQKLPVFSMNLFKLKRNKLTTSRAEPVLNGLSKSSSQYFLHHDKVFDERVNLYFAKQRKSGTSSRPRHIKRKKTKHCGTAVQDSFVFLRNERIVLLFRETHFAKRPVQRN
jgi:hypothetical protein